MGTKTEIKKTRLSILGKDVVRTRLNERVSLTSNVVERDFSANGVSAAEAVLEVSWRIDRPLPLVWEKVKDFNLWQNQHGYYWDGVVGDEEGNFVFMSDKVSSYGTGIPYAIRKVIPRQLIYLESLPMPYGENSGSWSGHNVMSFSGDHARSDIQIYMDHNWLSPKLGIEELLKVARSAVEAATGFWRSSFIPKLEEIVSNRDR
jgi:hypothetical protein